MINLILPDHDFDMTKYSTQLSYPPGCSQPSVVNFFPSDWEERSLSVIRTLKWLLDECAVSYTVHYASEGISKDIQYYFPISFNLDWMFFENFEYFSLIRDNNNISFLIYQGAESIQWETYQHQGRGSISRLEYYISKNQISPNQVKVICGDINAKNNSMGISKIDFLGINIFELLHHARHREIDMELLVEKKEFLCLNSFMRFQRQYFIYYLEKFNLYDNGLISALNWSFTVPDEYHHDACVFDDSLYNDFIDFRNLQTTKVITQNTASADRMSPGSTMILDFNSYVGFYQNTKYSIVNETYAGKESGLFITEKTYKPISMGHPFIIFGTTGTLSQLKKEGYETFPELFDESYDDCSEISEQIKIILENIKTPKTITPEILEKCQRNKNHFFKQTSRKTIRQYLENYL